MKVKVLLTSVVFNSCDPMDCRLPGSSVHGILQARILEWVANFSRGSSWPRDWPGSLAPQADSLPSEPPGKPHMRTSVQFSCSDMSDSMWPHGLQHARPPCPSPTPRVYSNSCPLNRWCHPTISSSVFPFSSCLQSFPASGSFQMNQFFASGIRINTLPKYWSFIFSISPSNEYLGLISFRMDWLDLLAVQATLKSLLQHHSSKASILLHSAFFIVQLSHPYMTTGKTIALTRQTFRTWGPTNTCEAWAVHPEMLRHCSFVCLRDKV